MSFFKDFKDDLSQAVNELMPGENLADDEELEESPEMVVNTLEGELDIESELSRLDGLLEPVDSGEEVRHVDLEPEAPVLERAASAPEQPGKKESIAVAPVMKEEPLPELDEPKMPAGMGMPFRKDKPESELEAVMEDTHFTFEPEPLPEPEPAPVMRKAPQPERRPEPEKKQKPEPVVRSIFRKNQNSNSNSNANTNNNKSSSIMKEEAPMSEEMTKETTVTLEEELGTAATEITDEVTIITAGTTIKGNLSTTGSFSISGIIEGNVQCNGKLEVTGRIKGNSSSSEVFSDAAKIEGEIVSTGTVKIGLGSVVVGNITATSAVIAGAVKGDIDVQGPVVVDTSAVIVGNIKSRSVQINNGAVIEGFCSQAYSDIDVDTLFAEQKGN